MCICASVSSTTVAVLLELSTKARAPGVGVPRLGAAVLPLHEWAGRRLGEALAAAARARELIWHVQYVLCPGRHFLYVLGDHRASSASYGGPVLNANKIALPKIL